MENEQYYSVALEDFATVSFVSGTKPYFGTLPEIEKFINSLKADRSDEPFFMYTVSAFESFKNGNENASHYAGNGEVRLITPVTVYDSLSYTLAAVEWKHPNIFNEFYKMRCSAAEITNIWVKKDDEFYRAMKVKFTGLEHDIRLLEDDPEHWEPFYGHGDLWGYPHIIEAEKPYTYGALAVPEKYFKTEEKLKADIDEFKKDPKPDFRAFCNDIFADG